VPATQPLASENTTSNDKQCEMKSYLPLWNIRPGQERGRKEESLKRGWEWGRKWDGEFEERMGEGKEIGGRV